MKLSEYKETYESYSKAASERTHIAAFAGIAIIWLFKKSDQNGHVILDSDLFYPFIIFILAIAADLLQYVVGYGIWHAFFRYQESKLEDINSDPKLVHPAVLAAPMQWLFIGKILLTLVGYILLSKHVITWF